MHGRVEVHEIGERVHQRGLAVRSLWVEVWLSVSDSFTPSFDVVASRCHVVSILVCRLAFLAPTFPTVEHRIGSLSVGRWYWVSVGECFHVPSIVKRLDQYIRSHYVDPQNITTSVVTTEPAGFVQSAPYKGSAPSSPTRLSTL